jgi:hypothetical protein
MTMARSADTSDVEINQFLEDRKSQKHQRIDICVCENHPRILGR